MNPATSVDVGKRIRLRRLIEPETNSCMICALDHGLTSPLFLKGLFDMRERVREVLAGGANVLMLSRGMTKQVVTELSPVTSVALMLSASAACRPDGAIVTPIGSVEEALRLGADAVVVYVALAGNNEDEMINYVSNIGEACDQLGMPFIAEAEYPNAYQTLSEQSSGFGPDYLTRNARLCAELGADIVKVNWSGSVETFNTIVRAAGVPVVVAGGTVQDEEEFLTRMVAAAEAGAVGVSVGRNVFQHRNPEAMMRAIRRVMVEKVSCNEALKELREAPTSPTSASEI